MRYEAIEKPEGWALYDNKAPSPDDSPEPGAEIGAFHEERTAQLVAVLLNAREAAPEDKPTPKRIQRQRASGTGAWAGNDEPQAGRVYSLSGLAGGGVAEDVTPEGYGPGPRAVEPRRDDDGPDVSRTPCGGGTVTAWPSGLAYVRFTSKPAAWILEELREAGARWQGVRRGWKLQAENLPEGYDRAAAAAGSPR
jgi:hypothetical protein